MVYYSSKKIIIRKKLIQINSSKSIHIELQLDSKSKNVTHRVKNFIMVIIIIQADPPIL